MNVGKIVKSLKFDSHGLIPVVAVDHVTGEVLMLAYANSEAIQKTLQTGYAHYFSRSRNKLWKKGETSGNFQEVVSIRKDCDSDALVYEVIQHGPACHTGNRSCFFEEVLRTENSAPDYPFLKGLEKILFERKQQLPENSYTAMLFRGAPEKIIEKISEESQEFIKAVKEEGDDNVIWEAADLLFFTMTALVWRNINFRHVLYHLWERHLKKKKGGDKGEKG